MTRPKRYAVLIPTKGRSGPLARLFRMCPSLNRPSTFIGLDGYEDPKEAGTYTNLFRDVANRVTVVPVTNPGGYTSCAREQLRMAAVRGRYSRYVLADDNCRFTDESLRNLLDAQELWDEGVMAGCHPTAEHFHAKQIAQTLDMRGFKPEYGGRVLRSYEQVGMIFWCVPHAMYKAYTYPPDCYFDDVHFILWCLTHGFTNFRSTLDARFEKRLHEPGGTGSIATRIRKRGEGFIRLATDFPQWMTTDILATRVHYKRIIAAVGRGEKGFSG